VGANILPPRSKVTYDRVGLTPAEQAQIAADWQATQPSEAAPPGDAAHQTAETVASG